MLGERAKKGELIPKETERGCWHSANPLSVTVMRELVGESFGRCCGPVLWEHGMGAACPDPSA